MVLDGVRGDDEGFGHLGTGEAAGQEGRDLALARRCAERLEADRCRPRACRPLEDDRDPAVGLGAGQ